ncbi:MAG: restriction endonuclease [Bacteroidales bacterium]|nr:restriction endonuclease [Bacteroidales bacterium]
MTGIKIVKNSGELEIFDELKLRSSMMRSGANSSTIDKVINELEFYLHDGISSHKVYKKAYSILGRISMKDAGKYRLKKAILELGPTGYPFEQFMGAILKTQGYSVKVGVLIDGKCVTHEVDVVAENDDKIIVVECKYHRTSSTKSDVKVPLYIRSRFNDIYDKWSQDGTLGNKKYEAWVVTNTRFTSDAERYGKCSGLILKSWNYPYNSSLKDMIDAAGLHPITSLRTLSRKDKKSLLDQGVVLCREISKEVLLKSNIKRNKIDKVIEEAKILTEL